MKQASSIVLVIFLFTTLLAACSGGGGEIVPGHPVTLTSIAISPATPAIAPGTTTQLAAIGIYSNNSRRNITTLVIWNSSDTGIANVGNVAGSHGLVTATSTTGSASIIATSSGITGSTTLTTSHVATMNVSPPAPPSIAPGTTLQFTAIGTLVNSAQQNLTTFATWTSSAPGVADVSNASGFKGLTTAVSAGTATITATFDTQPGDAAFKSFLLTSITVTPIAPSIAKGKTQQFTATGTLADSTLQSLTTFATWSSSTIGVATISNAAGSQGLATAVSEGTTTILATFTSITSTATLTVTPAVLSSITVTPTNLSVILGTAQQFIAVGTFTDSTTQDLSSLVTWNSSNISVAKISNTSGSKGLATSVNVGSTTITASSGGFSGSTTLTVTQAVLESIEIAPTNAIISIGTNTLDQQFTAIGRLSDGNDQILTTSVTWNSSNLNVATISNTPGSQGLATASFVTIPGATDITATFSGMTSNAATLIVN